MAEIETSEIRIACRGADSLPLDAIEEFQGNLKRRTRKDIEKIIKSITKYGFSFPFFVWQHEGRNLCLDGHGRIQALTYLRRKGAALPRFPVAYIEADNEADAKNKLLRLNSQYGEMTTESVLEFLGDVAVDFDDLALPNGVMKFSGLPTEETTGDDEIPEDIEPITREGDVYILNAGNQEHRLVCGDSRKSATVTAALGGRQIDLWLTDPPYNVDYVGKTKDALKIQNDKMSDAAFLEFLTGAFVPAQEHMRPGAAFYILHASTETRAFWNALTAAGLEVRQTLVWNKNVFVMGRQDYQWKHEGILYGWKDGAPHYWDGGRSQTTVREDSLSRDPAEMKKEELLELVKTLLEEKRSIATTVVDCDRPSRSAEHPTMKPVKLLAKFILNSSKKGQTVFDGFGGSGSTMIAAEQTRRSSCLIELDPHYCDVIVQRFIGWAEENGRPAHITRNGKPFFTGGEDEEMTQAGSLRQTQFGETAQEVTRG